jgi:hypothetical protein
MISYWIGMFLGPPTYMLSPNSCFPGYGTNYIGGTGATQSNAAWLVPICIQLLPALILGVGIMWLPQR